MLKFISIGMLVSVVVGGIVLIELGEFDAVEYTSAPVASSTPAAEPTPEPEVPSEWEQEAEAAYQAVIERKKLEKREQELVDAITVKQEELDEVRKELGVF